MSTRDRLRWQDGALCAQTDPELFFPDKGQPRTARQARAVCARCEVRQQCLDHAVAAGEQHGIWGGVSARARTRRSGSDSQGRAAR
jgi:WhiB family transcriptional regulator, redox-sensing transcriptional regulator